MAEPILSSSLSKRGTISDPFEPISNQDRLPIGCRSIDVMLDGGIDRGSICCISAEAHSGAQEIAYALLISHLLRSPHTKATVIDTGTSLDVRQIHSLILATIEDCNNLRLQALGVLDRLKIMRVFDFVGLAEGVGELRDGFTVQPTSQIPAKAKQAGSRRTVSDSEDDDITDNPYEPREPCLEVSTGTISAKVAPSGTMLLIDHIDQVAGSLLTNNYVQGQALLSSFMRSLSHMTRTQGLFTLILNSTTINSRAKNEASSIFSACSVRPSLGRSFSCLLDVHLLVHRLSKGCAGSKENQGGQVIVGEVEMCSVVEVLQDRESGRSGRWTAFAVTDERNLIDLA